MTDSQLIIALIIVGLTIIVPIIYSFKKKFEKRKLEEKLKKLFLEENF